MAIVVGGGNIFRGLAAASAGMDRATADYMGMLATVMNGLALQDALEQAGVPDAGHERHRHERDLRAVYPPPGGPPPGKGARGDHGRRHGKPVLHDRHRRHPSRGGDRRQVILKATRVDGVYSADPEQEPDARRYAQIGYTDLLAARLQALDATAVSLAMDNRMPIVVFDMTVDGNILRALRGESIGTLISDEVPA